MGYGYDHRITLGPGLTPGVKYLVMACVVVFLLQLAAGETMTILFGLTPSLVLGRRFLWQLVTYLFLHGDLFHILFNMLALWMFGAELERYWGGKRFLGFFFLTGVGAGLLSVIAHPASPVPTIGASGAVYGILMAYGMMFPDRLVYLYFLFPVKVKYFVAVLGAITFFSALSASGTPVDHVAHLGGMVFGFLHVKGWLSLDGIRRAYYRWKLKRMQRKFRVYEKERRKNGNDFWIH